MMHFQASKTLPLGLTVIVLLALNLQSLSADESETTEISSSEFRVINTEVTTTKRPNPEVNGLESKLKGEIKGKGKGKRKLGSKGRDSRRNRQDPETIAEINNSAQWAQFYNCVNEQRYPFSGFGPGSHCEQGANGAHTPPDVPVPNLPERPWYPLPWAHWFDDYKGDSKARSAKTDEEASVEESADEKPSKARQSGSSRAEPEEED